MSPTQLVSLVCFILLHQSITCNAFFVVNCTILQLQRVDPIVSPGRESSHNHVIAGAGNFNANASNTVLKQSTCSSCDTAQDMSAYWIPQLYVAPPNIAGTDQDSLIRGGALPVPLNYGKSFKVYYRLFTSRGERLTDNLTNWEPIVPFPENFRMVIPETMVLKQYLTAKNFNEKVVNYKCYPLDPTTPDNQTYTEDPNSCVDSVGLRVKLMTPSCWNGKDIDTPDHSSHMSYPTGAFFSSPCPPNFPVRLPTLFYEVSYNLPQVRYLLKQGWKLTFPKMVDQFVPGSNVPLFHADFMNGWNQTFLGEAVTQCGVTPCPIISNQTVCNML